MSYLLILLYSALIDVGAVIYTRSVQHKNVPLGALVTGCLAALNWASIWMVARHDDELLVVASVIGHVGGFVAGMVVPVRGESERPSPTTGPGSQSSGPS